MSGDCTILRSVRRRAGPELFTRIAEESADPLAWIWKKKLLCPPLRPMRHIVLFTPFEPHIGGGGAIFRSLVSCLADIQLRWAFLGSGENLPQLANVEFVPLSSFSMGGKVGQMVAEYLIWLGHSNRFLRPMAVKLAEMRPDLIWGNGHMEGLLISELAANRLGVPLHISMHDDLAGAQFARSRKLKHLRGRADNVLKGVLCRANSIDVVGPGMQQYYRDRWGIESVVVHRYIPALPMVEIYSPESGVLRAGHIGSVYSLPEFLQFVRGLVEFAASQRAKARLLAIGLRQSYAEMIEKSFPGVLERPAGHVPDDEVPHLLSRCAFVYSSYPFESTLEVFSRTSSPTKIATYVESQRPILVQAPAGSSSEQIVLGSKLGTVCTSYNRQVLLASMEEIMGINVPRSAYEQARRRYYGFDNVERLANCLGCSTRQP